jgi:hypothetical protein
MRVSLLVLDIEFLPSLPPDCDSGVTVTSEERAERDEGPLVFFVSFVCKIRPECDRAPRRR